MEIRSKRRVSVIVPTYLPGGYLKRCLTSLDRQTLSKDLFRVYVALNGATDSSKEYVESCLSQCSFDYRLYFLSEAGVSNARNFAIENSSESYVCFVDDDDVLSASYLESLLSASSETCMGISDVRTFKYDITDSAINYISNSYRKLSDIETSKFRARKYFSSPWAKMIHRGIIGDARFDTHLSKGEDALFMASLSPRVRSIKKARPTAYYYVYERLGSASRKKVSTTTEIGRVRYLIFCYFRLFLKNGSDKAFVFSRVVATIFQLKKLFR